MLDYPLTLRSKDRISRVPRVSQDESLAIWCPGRRMAAALSPFSRLALPALHHVRTRTSVASHNLAIFTTSLLCFVFPYSEFTGVLYSASHPLPHQASCETTVQGEKGFRSCVVLLPGSTLCCTVCCGIVALHHGHDGLQSVSALLILGVFKFPLWFECYVPS